MNVGSLIKVRSTLSFCYTQVRNSVYSPKYVDATFRKEHLEEEMAENDVRRFSPIRAALNEQSSFSTYDDLLARFMRHIMKGGEKDMSRFIMFKTFEVLKMRQIKAYNKASDFEKESIELDPLNILKLAIKNCQPVLKLDKVKRGGVMYQVPVPISQNSMVFFSMRWIIESARDKDGEQKIWFSLAQELFDAANNEGKSIRKKQELHRLCEANRAYAHFRW